MIFIYFSFRLIRDRFHEDAAINKSPQFFTLVSNFSLNKSVWILVSVFSSDRVRYFSMCTFRGPTGRNHTRKDRANAEATKYYLSVTCYHAQTVQPQKLEPIVNMIANIVPERVRRKINMSHVRSQRDGATARAARPSTGAVRASGVP